MAPDSSATGATSTESPPSRIPFAFQSRYTVTDHVWPETAATVKESAPFPRFVSVWENTTDAPGLPPVDNGAWIVRPAICATTRSTVSEGTM